MFGPHPTAVGPRAVCECPLPRRVNAAQSKSAEIGEEAFEWKLEVQGPGFRIHD